MNPVAKSSAEIDSEESSLDDALSSEFARRVSRRNLIFSSKERNCCVVAARLPEGSLQVFSLFSDCQDAEIINITGCV